MLNEDKNFISAFNVLYDGRIVTGSIYGSIKIWNPITGIREYDFQSDKDDIIVLEDNRIILISYDNIITILDLETNNHLIIECCKIINYFWL